MKFHSSGDPDTLNILAEYSQQDSDPAMLYSNVNEALKKLLSVDVLLITKDAMAASRFVKEEAEEAPLSDMTKVIDFFFTFLIPSSTEQYPDEIDRQALLQKWQDRNTTSLVSLPTSVEKDTPLKLPASQDTSLDKKISEKRNSGEGTDLSTKNKRHKTSFFEPIDNSMQAVPTLTSLLLPVFALLEKNPEQWGNVKLAFLEKEEEYKKKSIVAQESSKPS